MHRAAPYAALWRIISPHGEISDAALAPLSHRIFGHTSINVYSVIAVEVLTIDGANHMICCGHVVAINISALIHDYWGRGVMLLMELCLGILCPAPVEFLLRILLQIPMKLKINELPTSSATTRHPAQ